MSTEVLLGMLGGWALLAFPAAVLWARGDVHRGAPPNPPTPGVQHHVHHHFHHHSGSIQVVHGGVVEHRHTHRVTAASAVPVPQAALGRAPAALPAPLPRVIDGVVLNGRAVQR